REPQRADGFVGRVAAGRVRQNRVAPAEQELAERAFAAIGEVDTPERDRHDLCAGGLERLARLVHARVLARADEQARAKRVRSDDQRVVVFGGCAHRKPAFFATFAGASRLPAYASSSARMKSSPLVVRAWRSAPSWRSALTRVMVSVELPAPTYRV